VNATDDASLLQLLGAGGFGAILGWFLYFTNRYRKAEVMVSDVVTVIGAIGGAAILTLFPAETDLFGAYGIGLFAGFFGYLLVLVFLVRSSPNFDRDWFLDGRRKAPAADQAIPPGTATTVHAMDRDEEVIQS
jgi:hypothetical protein